MNKRQKQGLTLHCEEEEVFLICLLLKKRNEMNIDVEGVIIITERERERDTD